MTTVAETWVKVCGLTSRDDVDHAVASGADAIGIVVYEGSPRFVAPERVAELAHGVPVLTVVLTVDREPSDVMRLAEQGGVRAVQPYGRHAAATGERALANGLGVLRPVRAVPGFSLPPDDGSIPLLDTPHTALHGGSGETFDWALVRDIDRDFVLAGGLGPENVRTAIDLATPWGVDASSALESDPGKKDPGKVKAFIEEAKRR